MIAALSAKPRVIFLAKGLRGLAAVFKGRYEYSNALSPTCVGWRYGVGHFPDMTFHGSGLERYPGPLKD